MVRKEVIDVAKRFIEEDRELLRKLAEEHKHMKNDICIKCGLKDIAIKEKEFEFSLPNPGKITVS
jgi:cell wall assembly regulator SMI1